MYNTDFTIENGILKKYNGTGGDVVIPEGVIGIDLQAFANCETLTGVTIPDSVTAISPIAFANCKNLASVIIPDGVELTSQAFLGCDALADEQGFIIVNGVLYGYIGNDANVVIPDTVTVISTGAFNSNSNLMRVTIPDSVIDIDDDAVFRCENLTFRASAGSAAEEYAKDFDIPFEAL